MTPEQTAALERLVHRKLSDDEKVAIGSVIDVRNDVRIAEILSAGRVRPGPIAKGEFLVWLALTGLRAVVEDHSIDKSSQLRSTALTIKDFLVGSTDILDFSHKGNNDILEAWLSSGLVTPIQSDSLKAMSSVPDPISVNDVSDALNKAENRLTWESFKGGEA